MTFWFLIWNSRVLAGDLNFRTLDCSVDGYEILRFFPYKSLKEKRKNQNKTKNQKTEDKRQKQKTKSHAARALRHIEGFASCTFGPQQNNHRITIEMQLLFFLLRDAK